MYNQYQMEKYEKIEFDMNSIDSAFMKTECLGMEFISTKWILENYR
jgi:hypothetical protein